MSIDINGIIPNKIHGPPNESQVKQQVHKQPVNSETGQSSTADTISLSDNAVSLGKLNHTVETSSVVDMQRVEQMKKAIADGSFKVDAEQVAEKMMKFESILTSDK
ncbi:MAG: flagellar biosynthesis anti-sigma factor FlgM [Thiotrichaceae bacterium]|nr:MAG: flagellar biosynthesis anti-sigma factor FlgM [Thiotrichaceae bacterium]